MAYYFSPFRAAYDKEKSTEGCVFCDPEMIKQDNVRSLEGVLVENRHYDWLVNRYPRSEGHTLVIPKRHLLLLEDETPEEVQDRHELICYASKILKLLYPGSGTEIFLQTGAASEGTVRHLHWHVVPAMPSDQLRGWAKLGYFVTSKEQEEKVVMFPIQIKLAREELQVALAPLIQANPLFPSHS